MYSLLSGFGPFDVIDRTSYKGHNDSTKTNYRTSGHTG